MELPIVSMVVIREHCLWTRSTPGAGASCRGAPPNAGVWEAWGGVSVMGSGVSSVMSQSVGKCHQEHD